MPPICIVNVDRKRLTVQLKTDEGFIGKAKWDIKQWSYGYGCRAPGEGAVIAEPEAAALLEAHINHAVDGFNRLFAGHQQKFNDVRAEAFINLIFNMGAGDRKHPEAGGMASFVNTLGLIFKNDTVPWDKVADNLDDSKWYRQVKDSGDTDGAGPIEGRGVRIVRQIKTGSY